MRRPLPLAARSAFAWLRACRDPAVDQDQAREAARSTYEPGFNYNGECADSAYLSRAWPGFDALWAGGEFRELAQRLLRPLQKAIPTKDEKKSGKGAPE
jgi:exodeoxyribonuclease V gamma subunit